VPGRVAPLKGRFELAGLAVARGLPGLRLAGDAGASGRPRSRNHLISHTTHARPAGQAPPTDGSWVRDALATRGVTSRVTGNGHGRKGAQDG
jgi:hypothetical protein